LTYLLSQLMHGDDQPTWSGHHERGTEPDVMNVMLTSRVVTEKFAEALCSKVAVDMI